MEKLWNDDTLEQMPEISDGYIPIEQGDDIKEREGLLGRFKRILKKCLGSGYSEKKVKIEDFPASYIIVPEIEENQSEELYMEYARRYNGMDMMCTLKEYDLDESNKNNVSGCRDTSLILYSKEAEYVEGYSFPEKTIALSKMPCVAAHQTTTEQNPDQALVSRMIDWAQVHGLTLSSHLFTTVTMLSIKNGEFMTYLSLYIPILSSYEERLAG